MFKTFDEIINEANARRTTISAIALSSAAEEQELNEEQVFDRMLASYGIMKESAKKGMEPGFKSLSGLTGGMAHMVHSRRGKYIAGDFLGDVIAAALSVSEYNAGMGKIVAAPTAGSCGILPACLITLQNHFALADNAVIMGLFNASAVGMVIAQNASISGAEGGCQAECGTAGAMAASALVELMGGTPEMCGHAAALVLKSVMGLVCDPVAGLVEEPCIIRNASCAVLAVSSAEMALAGVKSIIPVDEVITAMYTVGRKLPESLRETAEGGLADTPTGRRIAAEYAGEE